MEDGEERTFRISLAGERMERLRDRVKEKLKEFMGEYTDDTLVDYVLVLLRNGRSKAEARRELNVFLGDDSVSFVSWLWDHLSSNLHLYVEPIESERETNTQFDDHKGTHNLKQEHVTGTVQKIDPEYERERLTTVSRNRRNRDWKGLVCERTNPFPLRSTVTEILQSEVKNHHRPVGARRSPSPRPQIDRKRSREDERPATKRVAASHPVIGAPRRLLQFAVRDAVRTVQQQSSSRSEPALKRLRSVVSASTTDSLVDEKPQRIRSVARVPGAVSAAFRAAAEAAEDVTKSRCSSVFDRLSHGGATLEPFDQPSNLREPILEDGECEDSDRSPVSDHADYYQRSEFDGEFTGDMTMLERDPGVAVDSASDNDGYDDVATGRHQAMDASQSASSANKDKNSLRLQYSVAQDAGEVVRKTRLIDQDPPAAAAAATPSSKIVNISVNVNTWKPPQYQVPRDVSEVENQMAVDKSEVNAGKTSARLPKENNSVTTENENEEMARTVVQKESQKAVSSTPGSYTISRPSEDVDSRTVFVSNVHFAATKDTLSRHFNKFGEVLKVIIVTDATTGQPKGSAYVEFLRKESAELALSLNGTSFMSRILKVVRRSSAHPETAPMLGWPRIARASPYASRIGRMPFPRVVLGGSAFRARLPIKSGARSLQWKRDTPTAQITAEATKSTDKSSLVSGNNLQSPTGRNLTYIRPESKAEGSSGVA